MKALKSDLAKRLLNDEVAARQVQEALTTVRSSVVFEGICYRLKVVSSYTFANRK